MIAIIIFGTRGVRSTVQQGTFICPQCQGQQNYKHKKVTQFFTLYFVPLIPLGNKGEYVECMGCRNTYITRILDLQKTIDISERQQPTSQVEAPAAQISSTSSVAPVSMESEKDKAIKKLLLMMILADGKVENAEIVTFHKVYHESTGQTVRDIYQELDEIRMENKQPHQYLKEVNGYLNPESKEAILRSCMKIAAADGNIDPSELRLVESFGKALEMRPTEISAITGENL